MHSYNNEDANRNDDYGENDAGLEYTPKAESQQIFLDFLNDDECKTPVLGANVVPKKGVSALSPKNNTDYIKPYTIVEKNGQKKGKQRSIIQYSETYLIREVLEGSGN